MLKRLALTFALFLAAAPATACTVPDDLGALVSAAVGRVNAERQAQGLAALSAEPRLMQAAQGHACDNAARRVMSHQGGDGSDLRGRLRRVDYGFAAANENVAMGYRTAESVVRGWMDSSGHRRNILARSSRDIGLGVALAPDGQLHWVLVSGATR
jgi:uncharacterized protein YkwD